MLSHQISVISCALAAVGILITALATKALSLSPVLVLWIGVCALGGSGLSALICTAQARRRPAATTTSETEPRS